MKLELTKRECEAVMSYIWQHSRASESGTAYKVWEKMWGFVNEEHEQEDKPETEQVKLF